MLFIYNKAIQDRYITHDYIHGKLWKAKLIFSNKKQIKNYLVKKGKEEEKGSSTGTGKISSYGSAYYINSDFAGPMF